MIWLVVTLFVSAALCGGYLWCARRWNLVAHPNERSSHTQATPHGGGIGMIAAFALVVAASPLVSPGEATEVGLIAATALFLVVVGVLDDLRGLSVRLRFALYALCCVFAVVVMMPAGDLVFAGIALLGLLWLMNLYNFMDGIDGIAASQAIVASGAAAVLAWGSGGAGSYVAVCAVFAAAQLGFLCWNWPPARLFMGDAGSIPTGFVLGALALWGHWQQLLPIACWLVLLGVFIADASYTLARRFARGENVTQAHREHVYQRLSRHWGSHLMVDLLLLAVVSLWLFPIAMTIMLWPSFQELLVILAYLPLLLAMAKLQKLA
jgi:Fuc2NAc and GlcNAc transferase